jgi:hypothetical protein
MARFPATLMTLPESHGCLSVSMMWATSIFNKLDFATGVPARNFVRSFESTSSACTASGSLALGGDTMRRFSQQIHLCGEHANVQFRLNGFELPDQI